MENFFQPAVRKSEPDWFRLGRDATRVMDQLNGMKELDFYLRHPEPFIRLQAIRRVTVLLLPDAVPSLGKMLDDPIENEQNRDEAGWAIRRISRAKGLSWFARNPYTDKYDGTEPPSARFGITVLPGENPTNAEIPVGYEEDARLEDEVLLRIQMDEKGLEVAFSAIHWVVANFRHLAMNLVKGFLRLLKAFGLGLLHLAGVLGKWLASCSKRVIHRMTENANKVRNAKADQAAAQGSAIQASNLQTSILPTSSLQTSTLQASSLPTSTLQQKNPSAAMEMVGETGQTETAESVSLSGTATHSSPNLLAGNPVFSGNSDKPVHLIGLEEAISSGTVSRASSHVSSFCTTATVRNSSPSLGNALSGISRHATSVRPAYRRRKEGNAMFRLLFYPVRLAKAHWLFTLAVLFVFYGLLGFTHTGRFVMSRLNPAALWSNDRFVSVTKLTFMEFFDIEKTAVPSGETIDSPSTLGGEIPQSPGNISEIPAQGVMPQYRITATKGLSLRTEPSKTASRIILMPTGMKVTYDGERAKDVDSGEWMKVSVDGKTGWAMAQWLESIPYAEKTGGSDGNP